MKKSSRSIKCPACGEKNTITKSKALNLSDSPACAACHKNLLPFFDRALKDISPDAFIHHLDHQMLDALRKIPGIDSVLKTMLRHSFELSMRLYHQGNFIQVSKTQVKSLNKKLEYAVDILDLGFMPELFVYQNPVANAYTFGVEKCSIAISSGALDLMTDDEILGILAHEIGHIKANHVLYKTASRLLSSIAETIAQRTLGLSGLVLYPIQMALLRWDRASELSSDRAALLVVKNPKVVLTMLMKLAGGTATLSKELSIKAFIEQAESYEKTQDEGPLGKYIGVLNSIFTTHPFPIWRARELLDWVDSGEYFDILSGNFKVAKKIDGKTCPVCQKTFVGNKCPDCAQPSTTDPYKEGIDKTLGTLKSWYDKNFNMPSDK